MANGYDEQHHLYQTAQGDGPQRPRATAASDRHQCQPSQYGSNEEGHSGCLRPGPGWAKFAIRELVRVQHTDKRLAVDLTEVGQVRLTRPIRAQPGARQNHDFGPPMLVGPSL